MSESNGTPAPSFSSLDHYASQLSELKKIYLDQRRNNWLATLKLRRAQRNQLRLQNLKREQAATEAREQP